MDKTNVYEQQYSESSFWDKVTNFAKDAGYEVIEKSLFLYYAYQEEDTPVWAKATIVGALGYFISPIDAIPDITPLIGYSDDLGVLVLAVAAISSYINDEVKAKVKSKLQDWFGK